MITSLRACQKRILLFTMPLTALITAICCYGEVAESERQISEEQIEKMIESLASFLKSEADLQARSICLSFWDKGRLVRLEEIEPRKHLAQSSAKVLGLIGDARAVEPLMECLNDDDLALRMAAVEALGRIGDSRAIEPLSKLMGEPKTYGGNIHQISIQQIWIQLLSDALEKLKPNRSSEKVKAYAEDMDQQLTGSGDTAVATQEIKALIDRLHYETSGRAEVSKVLGMIGKPAIKPLIEALYPDIYLCSLYKGSNDAAGTRPNALVVRLQGNSFYEGTVVEVFGYMGSIALESLMELLNREDSNGRKLAARSLGRIGDVRAVKALINCLNNDENSEVRASAAEALGNIRDASAIDALMNCMNNEAETQYARGWAIIALGKMAVDKESIRGEGILTTIPD